MFKGKESSNRNELSRLVQDLLNFGVLGSLRLWGWGGWVDEGGGWLGGGGAGWMRVGGLGGAPHTCAHARVRTHAHARTCMRGKHDNSMQMAAPIRFGEIPGIPYDVIRACACVRMHACACMCTCVGGPCHHPPPPSTHPPPGGGPPESVKIQ